MNSSVSHLQPMGGDTERRVEKRFVNALGQNQSIVNLREMRGLPFHPQLAHLGRIGIDFIPPMNALIGMHQTPITEASDVYRSTNVSPPDSDFRWDVLEDVMSRFDCNQLPLEWYARDAPDQGNCGSCWSFAGAGMFGDRWRVFTNTPVPTLSQTVILSCAKGNGRKCQGGDAQAVYSVCTRIGLPSEQCVPYDWCDTNCSSRAVPNCRGSTESYSSLCGGDGSVFIARDDGPQVSAIVGRYGSDYTAIMEEIWQNGPVMSGFVVYADFYGPTSRGGNNPVLWTDTGGIYMNGDGIYDYRWQGRPSSSTAMGNHMVAIVGWGRTRISGITGPSFNLPSGAKSNGQDIYFWVVRNSWGHDWNSNNPQASPRNPRPQSPGYFFTAWAGRYTIDGRSVDVNKEIGLDHTNSSRFGGCWFFSPKSDPSTANLPIDCQNPNPPPPDNNDNDNDNDDDDDDNDDHNNNDDDNCPNQNNTCPPCPKCPVNDSHSGGPWHNFVDGIRALFGMKTDNGDRGLCRWGSGQCVPAPSDAACDLISHGHGTYSHHEGTGGCNALPSNGDDTPTSPKLAPCLLGEGYCIMSTKKGCIEGLHGSWYQNQTTCDEARSIHTRESDDGNGNVPRVVIVDNTSVVDNTSSTPGWVWAVVAVCVVGAILLVGLAMVSVYYSGKRVVDPSTTHRVSSTPLSRPTTVAKTTLSYPKYSADIPSLSPYDYSYLQ